MKLKAVTRLHLAGTCFLCCRSPGPKLPQETGHSPITRQLPARCAFEAHIRAVDQATVLKEVAEVRRDYAIDPEQAITETNAKTEMVGGAAQLLHAYETSVGSSVWCAPIAAISHANQSQGKRDLFISHRLNISELAQDEVCLAAQRIQRKQHLCFGDRAIC